MWPLKRKKQKDIADFITPPRPRIKRKYVQVKEIHGDDELTIGRGQRIIDTKVIHEVAELAPPLRGRRVNSYTPGYKTIIVLECVEYE